MDFSNIIQIQNSPILDSFSFAKKSDGIISMIINYSTDLQNQPLDLIINPANSNNSLLLQTNPIPIHLTITPTNNQAAYFYDNSTYKIANIINKLCMIIQIVALILLLLSMINGKMIGIEMMAVLQICYFSLIVIN